MWCWFGHEVVTFPSESRRRKLAYSTVWSWQKSKDLFDCLESLYLYQTSTEGGFAGTSHKVERTVREDCGRAGVLRTFRSLVVELGR